MSSHIINKINKVYKYSLAMVAAATQSRTHTAKNCGAGPPLFAVTAAATQRSG